MSVTIHVASHATYFTPDAPAFATPHAAYLVHLPANAALTPPHAAARWKSPRHTVAIPVPGLPPAVIHVSAKLLLAIAKAKTRKDIYIAGMIA